MPLLRLIVLCGATAAAARKAFSNPRYSKAAPALASLTSPWPSLIAAGGELARDDDAAALKSANVSWNGEIDPQTFPLASSVAPYALDAPEDDEGVAEFDLPAFSLVGLVAYG